jgi:hypothetical protein
MNVDFTTLFNASRLGLKRTCVDWERDKSFVDHGDRTFVDMRSVHDEPFFLQVPAAYATDDVDKIRKLATAGHQSTNQRNNQYKKLGKGLVESLKFLNELEELVVYLGDVSWKDFVRITEVVDEEGNRRTVALV